MAIGDEADVLLRIRGTDDGGLRLLNAYRQEVQRLRRDIEELNRTGPRTQQEQERVNGLERIKNANEYRKVQDQAFAEQTRRIQQEQQAYARSFQARSSAQRRYYAAEAQAHAQDQRQTAAANNANAQYQQAQLRFQQRINAAHAQALQMDARLNRGRATGGTNNAQLSQLEAEDNLWRRLRNSVLAYWAARQAGQAIVGFVREGLQFNQILETAQLGIASLITATSKVRDVNGNLLTGAKALEGAYGLAADQMNKIRIAGLQTAATTEQLVDAFQQALGPGLKAGLNLDQIRQITVQIVQAAGAIGLPFNQLNQEVRSILDATIDRNSRVARVLSITNEEVRLAREQGRLAEFLNEKMAAFTVAGGRAAKTMFVLKSNIKEAFQVFAGQATQDLFTKMRDSLNAVFADAFDFKNLRIAEKFQGLVQAIQEVFSGVGDLFVSSLNSMIKGAEALSGWFERNRVAVELTVAAFVELAKQLGGILADATHLLGVILGISTNTGTFAVIVNTIADAISVIRDHAVLLLAAFVGTRLAITAIALSLIEDVIPAMNAWRVAALANPWTAVAVVLATILAMIIAAKEAQAAHNEMVTRTAISLAKLHGENVANLAKLTQEYQTNAEALAKTTKGTEAYKTAQENLNKTYTELLALAPELKSQSEFEKKSLKERLELLQKLAKQRLSDLDVEDAVAFNAAAAAKRELEAEKAKGIILDRNGLPFDNSGRIRELQETADRLQRVSDAATRANLVATSAFLRTNATLASLETSPSKVKVKGAANDPQQIRAAALERAKAEFDVQKAELQRELEFEEITRQQFHDRIIEEINKRADAEIAAHKRLLLVTTDKGERAKINADIEASEKQRIQDIATFERDTNRETRRIAKAAIVQEEKDIRELIAQSNVDVRQAANSIAQRVVSGEISKQQGAQEFKKVLQDQIDQTLDLIHTLEALKETTNDPNQLKAIDEMILRLNGHVADLNRSMTITDATLAVFGQKFRESTEKNLTDAIDTLLEKSHSLAGVWRNLDDVFRAMALSIISDITHIISRMIALQIVESALGLFGFGDFLTGIRAASGGYVIGPGTSTSDSVPARLSAGEYVVRASAVKQIGVQTLDAINYGAAGARMRRGGTNFAGGGIVESVARSGIASLRVGLDRGLILETMRSPEGAKIQIEHAQRHRNKLRQVSAR